MDERRLQTLLEQFPTIHVLVIGDFFLDFYLDIDRSLSEMSLETGLEAYQVIQVRSSPGAAGTVTSNLRALDVQVTALGVVGEDGMGYELLRGLRERGVNVESLIQSNSRFTPTYTKSMLYERDDQGQPTGGRELNRLDIKNRKPLPEATENRIIAYLQALVPQIDGVIVADQVQERNCGVVTDRVRSKLAELGAAHPSIPIAVDSRVRIGEYRNVMVKPNAHEALGAMPPSGEEKETDRAAIETCGRALCQQNGRPAFVTIGADGILVFDQQETIHVPGIHVPPPIDIVGAGDSVMSGIVSALCCGAHPAEAALLGNLVASITIQQIGTTGTATRGQVTEQYRKGMNR